MVARMISLIWVSNGPLLVTKFGLILSLLNAGFSLFLALMIDRLHHYIRELRILRKTLEAAKKQNRTAEETKNKGADEVKIWNLNMQQRRKRLNLQKPIQLHSRTNQKASFLNTTAC